jgi:hypothetical protein
VQNVLGDLRGAHNEFERFFGDVFDQLESMSLELFARHKCLELSTQHQAEQEAAGSAHASQFRECLEGLQGLDAKVTAAHDETKRAWSEIAAAQQQFLKQQAEFCEAQEEMRRVGAEFSEMREGIERDRIERQQAQESIQQHLERLASLSAESTAQSPSGHDEQLLQALEATRQQQAAWQQDRVKLEAELEAQRQRAAQQNEALDEQRRLVAQQQAELAGELKRMRSLIEAILSHMSQPSAANADAGGQAPASSEDAALGAMLAQFEMLQRELAQRRAGWQKPAGRT